MQLIIWKVFRQMWMIEKIQVRDLEATFAKAAEGGVEAVAVGTPIDLGRLVKIPVPNTRVRYELQVLGRPTLEEVLAPVLSGR